MYENVAENMARTCILRNMVSLVSWFCLISPYERKCALNIEEKYCMY